VTNTWDMLPPACRERFSRRRRVRLWVTTYALTIVALIATSLALSLRARELDHVRNRLAEQVRERWLRNEEAVALVDEVRRLQADITRYNRLAWPVRVSDTIDAIAPLVPRGCTLTALTLAPQEASRRRDRDDDEAEGLRLGIEVEGVAPSDAEVAEVVAGIDASPLFSGVKLDYAKSRDVAGVLARQFRIKAYVDLSTQYVLVDEPEGVAP